MARVTIDRADLRRVMRGASMRELRQVAPQVVNRAKVLAPVDTGRLRASIGPATYSRTWTLRPRATIEVGVSYGKMVHDGTRPHVIRPVRKQALKFTVGGQTVYAKIVHHPGTRPRPFLDRALTEIAGARGYRISE